MDISVLGDIATRIDGRPVDLGHPRGQSVFVGLLTDANRPVPVDELIERVWGQRPPEKARPTLYAYLSRLRAALGPAGRAAQVERQTGGYVLTLNEETTAAVDLHRFRELIARAGRTTDDGKTLALLDEALSLWKADAFGALDTPWIGRLRETLGRMRLLAQLDRNDLLLRRGRHQEIFSSLRSLAQRRPLDERVTGQLMLALYRERHVAQALDCYERTRQLLAQEKGAEPGSRLRDLRLRMLNADPSLDTADGPATAVGPRTAVPGEPGRNTLPASPSLLVGRTSALAELDAWRSTAPSPVVVISGLGGVGKTALALRWAHDNAAQFPDGQLYVNLQGFNPVVPATRPETVVRDLLSALGVRTRAIPAGAAAQYALYRSLLARRRILLLLDNAHDVEQVRPLLPDSATCRLMITSRNRLEGLVGAEGARSITLNVLSTEAARQFLTVRLGDRRTSAEPDAVGAIISRCGKLPLALAIATARSMSRPHVPLSVLAEDLRPSNTRFDVLETGDRYTSLRGVFDTSYNALPPDSARMLRLVALAPGRDFTPAVAAALTGLPPARSEELLSNLESAHLAHRTSPGRYALHDMVRLNATERSAGHQPAQERSAALHALIGFQVRTAAAAHGVLNPCVPSSAAIADVPEDATAPPADLDQALRWFESECHGLPQVIRLAGQMNLRLEGWRLARDIHPFLRRGGHLHDLLAVSRAGLEAAMALDRPGVESLRSSARRDLASALLLADQPSEQAVDQLCQALTYFEASGDLFGQARVHQELAAAQLAGGRRSEALGEAVLSLKLCEAAGDAAGKADALTVLSQCLAGMRRYEQAESRGRAALEACRSAGHPDGEASALQALGHIATGAGRPLDAVEHHGDALVLFRRLRDAPGEADSLSGLASAHAALGRTRPAGDAWLQALALYRAQHRDARTRETEERLRGLPAG
ncbi:SARP family transcriptional regulator [Streptomyces camponoticapitis]|uniref:SARP family transcriptional regulator n=1 Tax=Streptomyces camponoticapitis TaxID=1616125 RepID=A0ABQ2EXZ9_9ACTN|nr:BTAD domain-containing putative transcriptional regulator [Streptomyces camponoticapitis]GGK31793.1 SARP family transcriptional regulator [Streptomyces camponoticapitis]